MTVKSLYHHRRVEAFALSYEVIKRVGRKAYRYRVDRERDPETGRSRARWVYLGTVDPASASPASVGDRRPEERIKRPAGEARLRLLDAFERIAEREAYGTITAGAIAVEAGLAHGTFYRYFRDKRDLLEHALERVRTDLARIEPSFDPPYGTSATERLRVRAWLAALYTKPAEHPGVMRAFYEALDVDAELRAGREERRRLRVARLSDYLAALCSAGTIDGVCDAEALAASLSMLIEATFRAAIARTATPAAAAFAVAGTIEVVDRSVFASAAAIAAEPNGTETAAWTAAVGTSATDTRAPVS